MHCEVPRDTDDRYTQHRVDSCQEEEEEEASWAVLMSDDVDCGSIACIWPGQFEELGADLK